MSITEQQKITPFTVTASAIKRLSVLLGNKPDGTYLRVKVLGGGCSGLQYDFSFHQDTPASDDFICTNDAVTVAVDVTSLALVNGSALDYSSDIGNACFRVVNPNASANCGCGNSFSVNPSLLPG